MVQQVGLNRGWLTWALTALLLCLALLLAIAPLISSGLIVSQQGLFHTVTIGGVACPQSFVVGWTLGHGWSVVTNVAVCRPGDTASWLRIGWRDGKRTSLCFDTSHLRC